MPDFLLRDLPEDLMTALRQRAERHGRSLQSEVRVTLTESVRMPWDAWAIEAAALRARTVRCAPNVAAAVALDHTERDAAIDRALDDDQGKPTLP